MSTHAACENGMSTKDFPPIKKNSLKCWPVRKLRARNVSTTCDDVCGWRTLEHQFFVLLSTRTPGITYYVHRRRQSRLSLWKVEVSSCDRLHIISHLHLLRGTRSVEYARLMKAHTSAKYIYINIPLMRKWKQSINDHHQWELSFRALTAELDRLMPGKNRQNKQ